MPLLDKISWPIVVLLCLTLGLAPFVPEPHIWEKLKMLVAGELHRPVDLFDLLYHSLPWLLALAKAVRGWRQS
ncbi:MAG: RND transporter [Rhodobacterales bacterium 34-62-10]|nr:MAG: RND transporter [Rhodobacterales bacterium 34-62-10]